MDSKTVAEKPDQKTQEFEAAKALFEQAKRRTALEQGLVDAAGKPTVDAPLEPKEAPKAEKAEEPKEEPAPKPKPKAKAQKPAPAAAPAPDPMAPIAAQLKALEEKIAALATPKAPEPEPVDPLESIRGKLAERFGEDEAGALVEALEAINAPAAKEIAQLKAIIAEATTHGRKQIEKTNRKRLAESFPHLKESDEAWSMVKAVVDATIEKEPKKYGSIEDAYDDVTSKLFGSLVAQEDVETEEDETDEDVEEVASRIAAASMTAPAKAGSKERRSREDKMREHFEYLKKHPEDKAGARRLARELGIDR